MSKHEYKQWAPPMTTADRLRAYAQEANWFDARERRDFLIETADILEELEKENARLRAIVK